jgi:uncharacterized membrane protein
VAHDRAPADVGTPGFKWSYLIRGTPGHPLHPLLAHITMGAYATGAVLAVLGRLGVSEHDLAKGWWLAILVGLASSVATATTGAADFFALGSRNPARRTTWLHLSLMLPSTPAFGMTLVLGHRGYVKGVIGTPPFVLTLAGVALVMIGGYVGGKLVFSHGLRVEPLRRMSEASKAEVADPAVARVP